MLVRYTSSQMAAVIRHFKVSLFKRKKKKRRKAKHETRHIVTSGNPCWNNAPLPSVLPRSPLWTIRRLMSEQLAGSTQHVCFYCSLFNHSLSPLTLPHLSPSLSSCLSHIHLTPPSLLRLLLHAVHGWCSVLFSGTGQHNSVPSFVVSGNGVKCQGVINASWG